jgi:hypothetical protein
MKLKYVLLCPLVLVILFGFQTSIAKIGSNIFSLDLIQNSNKVLVVVKNAQGEEFFSKVTIEDKEKNLVTDPSNSIPKGVYCVIASGNNNQLFDKEIIVN